jgi:hypothetical protein
LAERVAHESAWRRVVAAYPRVYVLEELAPLRDGHASLQDAGRSALVQLAVDKSERLGHSGDAPSLGSVRGEFPSIHPGDILVALVPLVGVRLYVHGLGLVGAYPSSRESTYALLTLNSCIKVRLDLQADKSPVVVKGPLFPRVVNPRYRIRGTNV